MRLDINYKKKYKKHKRMEIEQYISKYQTDNWRNIKGNLKILETNDNENTTIQNLWDAGRSSSKREVYSNTILPQEIRKTT